MKKKVDVFSLCRPKSRVTTPNTRTTSSAREETLQSERLVVFYPSGALCPVRSALMEPDVKTAIQVIETHEEHHI